MSEEYEKKGWIKIHRKIVDWEWYGDPPTMVLFIHLLLKANRHSKKYKGYKVGIGSVVAGRYSLAEQTGLSPSQIVRSLDKLKKSGEVNINATNKFSIITITNWEDYQSSEQQTDNKRTSDEQQTDTPKEGKKERSKEVLYEGEKFIIPEKFFEKWREACPKVDIPAEIKKAEAWYFANPKKQKKNHGQFLTNWITRATPTLNKSPLQEKERQDNFKRMQELTGIE